MISGSAHEESATSVYFVVQSLIRRGELKVEMVNLLYSFN